MIESWEDGENGKIHDDTQPLHVTLCGDTNPCKANCKDAITALTAMRFKQKGESSKTLLDSNFKVTDVKHNGNFLSLLLDPNKDEKRITGNLHLSLVRIENYREYYINYLENFLKDVFLDKNLSLQLSAPKCKLSDQKNHGRAKGKTR